MALIRRPRHGYARQVLGEDRSRQPMIGAAVDDPKRRIASANYRIAKGSFALLGRGVLLDFGGPCKRRSLAGHEHGRTIRLAKFAPGRQRAAQVMGIQPKAQVCERKNRANAFSVVSDT
jgi:hypothetical protein